MTKATIGSVSYGTLRDQDLLRAFAEELGELTTDVMEMELVSIAVETADILDSDDTIVEDRDEAQEQAGHIIEELTDRLQKYAPPFCYFGAHEGDGSDFGFWPSWDEINDDIRDMDNILKISDTSEAPEYVLHVNDHGNATLYRVELKEEWAVV